MKIKKIYWKKFNSIVWYSELSIMKKALFQITRIKMNGYIYRLYHNGIEYSNYPELKIARQVAQNIWDKFIKSCVEEK